MIVLLAIGGLLLAGLLYQIAGEYLDTRRYPAPGKLLALSGGVRLHVHPQGNGRPTVVMEAGIAGSSLSWTLVQPLIASFTRVASYDRAGLGWSTGRIPPRTVDKMIAEFAEALSAADLTPPYILVGHSFGCLLIQAFAHAHPSETAGLVLVDPVTPSGWANATQRQLMKLRQGVKLSRRGAWLAHFGIVRAGLALLTSGGRFAPKLLARAAAGQGTGVIERLISEVRKLPPDAQPIVAAHWSRSRSFRAMAAYLECLPESARAVLAMPIPLEIPFVILSAATSTEAELAERESWLGADRHARHVTIPETGHWLQLERPDTVAAAVLEITLTSRYPPLWEPR